jgi:membrane associated rhomboid family serine protease
LQPHPPKQRRNGRFPRVGNGHGEHAFARVTSAATVPVVDQVAPAVIRARSEQQAMDWSLVLVSQGIACALDRDPESGGWQLALTPSEQGRALEALRLYHRESRRSRWEHALPDSELTFHAGVLIWVAVLSLVHAVGDRLTEGTFAYAAAGRGEWWRAFTALWLHEDIAHLATNAMTGSVFTGLAMARYRAGLASLVMLLAGAGANCVALWVRPDHPGYGLGASGMVMAAVGMLTVQALPLWRYGRRGTRVILGGLAGGTFLFIGFGTSPTSDVLAHAIGFAGGLLLGGAAALLPSRWLPVANRISWGMFALLVAVSWSRVPFR